MVNRPRLRRESTIAVLVNIYQGFTSGYEQYRPLLKQNVLTVLFQTEGMDIRGPYEAGDVYSPKTPSSGEIFYGPQPRHPAKTRLATLSETPFCSSFTYAHFFLAFVHYCLS